MALQRRCRAADGITAVGSPHPACSYPHYMTARPRSLPALGLRRGAGAAPCRLAARVTVLAVAAPAGVALLGSCSSSSVGGPRPPLTLCGTTLWHGAAGLFLDKLSPPRPGSHAPAPSGSVLPPRVRNGFTGIPLLVQVSPGCAHGRVVRVLGAAHVQTAAVAHAADGLIVGFMLVYTRPGRRLTSWPIRRVG